MEGRASSVAAATAGAAPASPPLSPTASAGPSPSSTAAAAADGDSAEARLHALEAKMAKWKEAVATQLNDATRKNKKVRDELRGVREERDAALSALRVQLTEEFQERTAMQREELAELTKLTAQLREEKKAMAAAHEAELTRTRLQLRDVLQLEVAADYKRKEEQWGKEKANLVARTEAKETERVQADHECEVLRVRLARLGAQYEELASLLQPKGVGQNGDGVNGGSSSGGASPTTQGTSADGNAALSSGATSAAGGGGDAARQQNAMNATFARQIDSIKAELQSKEQQTQFMLDRARQEHEAEKAQLLRELQLREEELKVAHTLLKQVQAESSGYLQRVSHAQTERQALEQRYAGKVAALSADLAEKMRSVDEAQRATQRLQEQLRTAQQQVATLEEESTMREEALHALMLSEDNKRLVMDLQTALQAARDEAADWKMQYYTAVSAPPATTNTTAKASAGYREGETAARRGIQDGNEHEKENLNNNNNGNDDSRGSSFLASAGPSATVDTGSPHTFSRSPKAWEEQLAAREAKLSVQAVQLEHKSHLLEAAEAKLNDMRRSLAAQASQLLQQQTQRKGRRDVNRGGDVDDVVFRDNDVDEDGERDMMEASPVILTAASLLPTSLHNTLRTLEGHRRRLHLPGGFRCFSCFFSGGGASGAPLRLRRNPLLLALAFLILLALFVSSRAIVSEGNPGVSQSRVLTPSRSAPPALTGVF